MVGATGDLPPPGLPVTILAGGSTETVPAFQVEVIGGNSTCGVARCGGPGEAAFEFGIGFSGRLSGFIESSAPIGVWVGNALGMEATCTLFNPPPPCAPIAAPGPPHLYQTPSVVTSLDFGKVSYDFGAPGSALPSGTWTILLINWSDAPVSVVVLTGVVVTPLW